jgi:rSAM/selenodomain-associated transferase 1
VAALPSLILFARTPILGAVKTRLTPALSPEGALALYTAFLEDAARAYGSALQWQPVLAAEPEPDHPLLARLFAAAWRRQAQGPGDLGQRLTRAFEAERARGAPAVLAVGADHPALALGQVARAFDAISAGQDAAVVPAEDGGYCAIALGPRASPTQVFGDVPWSTSEVLAVTRERLRAAGLLLTTLETAYDVDCAADLERLRRDLARRDPGAPDFPIATARALAALDAGVPR